MHATSGHLPGLVDPSHGGCGGTVGKPPKPQRKKLRALVGIFSSFSVPHNPSDDDKVRQDSTCNTASSSRLPAQGRWGPAHQPPRVRVSAFPSPACVQALLPAQRRSARARAHGSRSTVHSPSCYGM
jgi:hypothetical protein